MTTISSPILLDQTGQSINETLQGISETLRAANTLIDDEGTSATRVWSSQKTVAALTATESNTGSTIICNPIAATPVVVYGTFEAGPLTLTQTNGSKTRTYSTYLPANGTYNFGTGELQLENGEITYLAATNILALPGANTFSISEGTITVEVRVLGSGSSAAPSYDIIYGGNAKEV